MEIKYILEKFQVPSLWSVGVGDGGFIRSWCRRKFVVRVSEKFYG